MLKVYGFGRVVKFARGRTRDLRVLWALEELQLPFELVGMDQPEHEMSTDKFRALNPFEQLPAIDDEGLVLTESGAILIYLAKKAGTLIPADTAGEAQVVRWCFAAVNTVEFPLFTLVLLEAADQNDPNTRAQRERTLEVANRFLAGLERWLEGREYLTSETFTVADILMAHVLSEPKDRNLLKLYPRVLAYRERCKARPAWQRTIASYCERVEQA